MKENKEIFLKWIKKLFELECMALFAIVIGFFPALEPFARWIRIFLSVGSIFCLYQLIPMNERYQKAVLFSGIATIFTLITNFGILVVLSIPLMVCTMIGEYQQFFGHAEILLTIDNKLSKKWHTLFMWNVFGPMIIFFVTPLLIVIPVVMELFDENVISMLTTMIANGFVVILQLVYVIYLKRMHEVCEKYEHWE